MKKLYFAFLFLTCIFAFAQQQPSTGDIEGLKIYPNPATGGKVFISTPQNAPKKILIFDVLGTQILETSLLGNELSLYNVDPGIYVIRIFEKDKMATRKLIVK